MSIDPVAGARRVDVLGDRLQDAMQERVDQVHPLPELHVRRRHVIPRAFEFVRIDGQQQQPCSGLHPPADAESNDPPD